ncbi:hypothetical protein [Leeuwenhoekiella sp. NPDC079379]|uniref:hypothetical protein n=1 Tax=Leeuwenhoekiella sp. NPDC079379 TaxID=3364122 RepID=UPI0037CB41CC
MKKILSLACILILISGCNTNNYNANSLKSIGALVENESTTRLTSADYEQEATAIIERGKSRLRDLLPNVINGQINLYKTTLEDIEAQAVLTLSYEESADNINAIRDNALQSLLKDELQVNAVYYEVVNELSMLNEHYSIVTDTTLIDYFDAQPFVLAEDVLVKIDELLGEEKGRLVRESRNVKFTLATYLLAFIPAVGQISKVVEVIIEKAKNIAEAAGTVKETIGVVSNGINLPLKTKVADYVFKELDDPNIVRDASRAIRSEGFPESASMIYNIVDNKQLKQTASYFKSIDNKLPGRIGDFSDGILTQPIGQLRKMMQENTARIENNTSTALN